ncbi:MAG: DUF4393 domain-containing protein [Oscillospiraceae bacterium]|nr:DUF4393 domain-containing protein [Oscillospiraceae bacterium]
MEVKLPEKLELPQSIDKAIENLTDEPTATIGSGFSSIFSLVFNPLIHIADKQKLKYAHSLEIYKHELNNKINAIPSENHIEPKLQIVAQALEDSKYCVEEPELREMFSNLIASASDKTKAGTIHPSFSNILKQMSSQDAFAIQQMNQSDSFAIAKLIQRDPNKEGFFNLTGDILIPESSDVTKTISSDTLSNLVAFGLICINYSYYFTAEDKYEIFDRYAEVTGYKSRVERDGGIIDIQKGVCELTPYGTNFCKVCIS